MNQSMILAIVPTAFLLAVTPSGCEKKRVVEVTSPAQGSIEEAFEAPARTRLAKDHVVRTPIDGMISGIDLRVGDSVTKGQVLATYDRTELEQELAGLEAQIRQYQIQQKVGQNVDFEASIRTEVTDVAEAMKHYMESAQAAVASAEAILERRKASLAEAERLAARGAGSQDSVRDLQLEADSAQINLTAAQAKVAAFQAIQAAVDLTPVMVDQYQARRLSNLEPIAAQIAQVEARKRRVEHRLTLATIASPIDGVVLEILHAGSDTLPAGHELVRIGSLSDLEVVAEVLTRDAQRIGPGSEVELTVGSGAKKVAAKVGRIEPEGFTKVSSLGIEQQRVRVVLEWAEGGAPAGVGIGYEVDARFVVDRRKDVLLVPRFAVLQDVGGTYYALAVAGGKIEKRTIELGTSNDRSVEVTKGLSESDQLVAQPDTSYEEGQEVEAAPRK